MPHSISDSSLTSGYVRAAQTCHLIPVARVGALARHTKHGTRARTHALHAAVPAVCARPSSPAPPPASHRSCRRPLPPAPCPAPASPTPRPCCRLLRRQPPCQPLRHLHPACPCPWLQLRPRNPQVQGPPLGPQRDPVARRGRLGPPPALRLLAPRPRGSPDPQTRVWVRRAILGPAGRGGTGEAGT